MRALFDATQGIMMEPAVNWRYAVKSAARGGGVDLRHSFASVANSQGVPTHNISRALGHSSIAVASGIYTRLFDETQRETLRTVAAIDPPKAPFWWQNGSDGNSAEPSPTALRNQETKRRFEAEFIENQ